MTLALLARMRVPQVVVLTAQTDPSENGVYEVLPGEPATTLVRVGDPSRRGQTARLGAGWGVSRDVDAHGFSRVDRVVDQATTDAIAATMRDAFAMPWAVGS